MQFFFLVVLLVFASPTSASANIYNVSDAGKVVVETIHPTLSIDFTTLKHNKVLIQNNDAEMIEALNELRSEAKKIFSLPKRSVIEKNEITGIDSKNDFVSMGPYWWPDPSKPDGLPYIRKDGVTNPEVRKITDKTYLNELSDIVYKLGLLYYYTGDKEYANEAIDRLNIWFIDPATRMNPNLKHGQYVPGRNTGRAEGVIDTRVLIPLVDGIQLLRSSSEWSLIMETGINKWFSDFLNWLETSELGIRASKQTNNIGTAYYMQVIQFNIFLGRVEKARIYAYDNLPKLIDKQIDKSGVQVHEVKRTNSWSYSLHNLSYWFNIANMLEVVGVDLWNLKTRGGRSINMAFEFLMPYATGQKSWGDKQLRNVDYANSFSNLYQLSKDKFKEPVLFIFRKTKKYPEIEALDVNAKRGVERLIVR